jgi:O-antigen/teichoic acid export membrane protein
MSTYKKNILANVITQILKFIIGMIISIIVARALGPQNQGIVAYTLTIISIFVLYGHFSILNSHNYFIIKKKKYKKENIFQNNITFALIISLSWILILLTLSFKGYIFIDLIKSLNHNIFIFFLIFLAIPIKMIGDKLANTLFLLNKIIIQNKIIIITKLIFLSILSILFYFNNLTIKSYLLFFVFFEFCLLIFYFFNIKIPFKFYLNKLLIKEEFKFGIQIFLGGFFLFLILKIDIFFIKYFLDTTEVGIYSIGVTIAEKLWLIPSAIGMVLYSKLLNSFDEQKNNNITFMTIKFCFFICSLIILPIIIFAPLFVNVLYGINYERSALIIQLLLPGVLIFVIGKIMIFRYVSKGKPKINIIISFICFVLNLILNIILIPKFGINGAAIASSISYSIFGFSYLFMITKIENKFKFSKFFWISKKEIIIFKNLFFNPIKKNKHLKNH